MFHAKSADKIKIKRNQSLKASADGDREFNLQDNKQILNKSTGKKCPTVPEPFEMTKREEEKLKQRVLALNLLSTHTDGNSNFLKPESPRYEHFKAIEMPDHVREKRYEKMLRRQENKRLKAKEEASRELLMKIKPFSFVEREERKNNLKRSDSVPNMKTSNQNDFQANPFPEHLFTDFAYEQQKEKENYREIQKKLRQEMLLKKSDFPPRIKADFLKKKMQDHKEVSKQGSSSLARKKKISKTNLDRLYREYKQNLEKKTLERELSVDVEKIRIHDRQKNKKMRPQSADSSYKRKQFSDVDHNNNLNLTTQLRLRLIEERQMRQVQQNIISQKLEERREERARRRRLNNPVWDNLRHGEDQSSVEEMTLRRLQEQRVRSKNYKLELEQMMRRVENQPTLFQKQSQVSCQDNGFCK